MLKKALSFLFAALFLASCADHREPIHIGYDPYSFGSRVGGQESSLEGFLQDLFLALSQKSHGKEWLLERRSSIDFENATLPEGLFAYLKAENPKPWKEKERILSDPILKLGLVLVTDKNSKEVDLSELKGKSVGLFMDEEGLQLLSAHPDLVAHFYPSPSEMLASLAKGEIQGALLPSLIAIAFVRDLYAQELKIQTEPLTDSALFAEFARGKKGLEQDFNYALERVLISGEYHELCVKWKLI